MRCERTKGEGTTKTLTKGRK